LITAADVWAHLDALAKPRRSLGRLEELAVSLALTQQRLDPVTRPRRVVLFAADHGVAAEGVSAWPSEVTRMMVDAIIGGRASSNAIAAAQDCDLGLVDVGVLGPEFTSDDAIFRRARIAQGSSNLARCPALTLEQFNAAWAVGAEEARRAIQEGAFVLIAGEMGIANTTPAACLTSLLTGVPADQAVGRGAGSDDAVLARKRQVIGEAVGRALPLLHADPALAIASVAGLEIAAMAGFHAEAARAGATVLVDGYVATAAALVAERLAPGTRHAMIAGHLSAEPGHRAALEFLELTPLLEWGMRLGEGTGALVALPLLDSAAALLTGVARLDSIGAERAD
jgi:nicotinate-nucleotide--dimethylbenzimidazole phosphoribosyltransferase